MGGGDLLNLLIERDTFPEDFSSLCLQRSYHKFGFIHRDVKPDVRSVLAVWDSLNLVSLSRISYLILKDALL